MGNWSYFTPINGVMGPYLQLVGAHLVELRNDSLICEAMTGYNLLRVQAVDGSELWWSPSSILVRQQDWQDDITQNPQWEG